MIDFKLDTEQLKRLEETIRALPMKSEATINDVLHTKGVRILKEEITKLLPISKDKGKLGNKKHAKTSSPFDEVTFNLGFIVKSKGGAARNKNSFGYLVFPNEGRGPYNPIAQNFMERGLENAIPKILSEVEAELTKKLEEEL